jgi:predicted kinase
MKQLILFRGLPGCGKSSLSESLCTEVWSADMYFERDGEYFFDATKLSHAHDWCKGHVEKSLWDGTLTVGVANTFTQEWEMQPYFELAKKYGYRVSTVIVENRHESENVHGVPTESLEKMKSRFEVKL